MIEVPTGLGLSQQIAFLRSKKPVVVYPKKTRLTPLKEIRTSEQAKESAKLLLEFADSLETFDIKYAEAEKAFKLAKPECEAIENQIEGLIFEATGLSELSLPKEALTKLWGKAWSGADTESEAIENLENIVEAIKISRG